MESLRELQIPNPKMKLRDKKTSSFVELYEIVKILVKNETMIRMFQFPLKEEESSGRSLQFEYDSRRSLSGGHPDKVMIQATNTSQNLKVYVSKSRSQ